MSQENLHEFDQATAFVAENLPPFLRRFYEGCINCNFTELQAMQLVVKYLETTILSSIMECKNE
jgi:hypothetical protein